VATHVFFGYPLKATEIGLVAVAVLPVAPTVVAVVITIPAPAAVIAVVIPIATAPAAVVAVTIAAPASVIIEAAALAQLRNPLPIVPRLPAEKPMAVDVPLQLPLLVADTLTAVGRLCGAARK